MGNVMYQWSNTRSFADTPLALPSDSINPDVDWGPSGMDVRHRLTFMLNTPIRFGLRTGIFRGGCLTGPGHSGARLHGFLAYLMKCTVTGTP
jgi:hypothetical protein